MSGGKHILLLFLFICDNTTTITYLYSGNAEFSPEDNTGICSLYQVTVPGNQVRKMCGKLSVMDFWAL